MADKTAPASSTDSRRAAMPTVASFVDWCRAAFGTEFVDHQMAVAQAARREYVKILQEQGPVAAKRWHVANAHRCTFSGDENGRTVGMPSPFGNDL